MQEEALEMLLLHLCAGRSCKENAIAATFIAAVALSYALVSETTWAQKVLKKTNDQAREF